MNTLPSISTTEVEWSGARYRFFPHLCSCVSEYKENEVEDPIKKLKFTL